MSDEEYTQIQQTLVIAAQLLLPLDLDRFLQAINHAETVAPILDPTLWIRGSRKLEQVKELAEAARKMQAIAQRHFEEHTK